MYYTCNRISKRVHTHRETYIRQMSGQVSPGLAGEYQSDERAGVARLSFPQEMCLFVSFVEVPRETFSIEKFSKIFGSQKLFLGEQLEEIALLMVSQ